MKVGNNLPIDEYLVSLLNQIYAPSLSTELDLEKKNQLYEALEVVENQIITCWLQEHGWKFNATTVMWEKGGTQ